MKQIENKKAFIEGLSERFGPVVTRAQLRSYATEQGVGFPRWFIRATEKAGRGEYRVPADGVLAPKAIVPAHVAAAQAVAQAAPQVANVVPMVAPVTPPSNPFDPNAISIFHHAEVPLKDPRYVPFGEFKTVKRVIDSRVFFPVFISGHSGNGKTFMVQQICARSGRLMVRVQMSRETDEDDLIGGFRLVAGETKFMKGPVIAAMEAGAILLIDEADRADPGKIMCLQGILEGKEYYIKKTGEVITPQPGFNIIVTANTKGKGSDDGRYVAATVLDDAWLERFPITIEQNFPGVKIEKRILSSFDIEPEFIEHLVAWSAIIRKTFDEDAIDELISTRRLVHIAITYELFRDRKKAIELCVNRFDEETKRAFLDLYSKVDGDTVDAEITDALNEMNEASETPEEGDKDSDDYPF